MNDEKLKELFKEEHSTPNKPANEWASILNKIETKTIGFNFFPPIAASVFVLTLVIIGMSVKPNFNQMYDDELGEYLFSESYFEEQELSFYSDTNSL